MDKILLGKEDLERLLKWRDDHKELVRKCPAPLSAVEIILSHNGYMIKGFRNEKQLKLHLNHNGRSLGSTVFELTSQGTWLAVPGKEKMKTDREGVQSVLTVYCSLMALMTYCKPTVTDGEAKCSSSPRKPAVSPRSGNSRITYVLRTVGEKPWIGPAGSHASPRGEFNVRGHYRHYKSGKVVWINEYRKGTGDRSKKTYKLGGKQCENC